MAQTGTTNQRSAPRWRHLSLLVVPFLVPAERCNAQQFLEDAHLVDVRVGDLSRVVDDMAGGTGLLSDGTVYSFDRYYGSNWADLRLTWVTPVSKNTGIYWGFGTGERGPKYRIDPSLTIGFVAARPLTDNSYLSLSIKTVLWGYLVERSCTADYGAIGGVQEVNCRMAGSFLPPSETLKFLKKEPPGDQVSVTLRYQLKF